MLIRYKEKFIKLNGKLKVINFEIFYDRNYDDYEFTLIEDIDSGDDLMLHMFDVRFKFNHLIRKEISEMLEHEHYINNIEGNFFWDNIL